MLTCNELYQLLNMKNPEQYAEERFKKALDTSNTLNSFVDPKSYPDWSRRRSGRSTKTYIEVISSLSAKPNDKLYFLAPHAEMAKCHVDNIKNMIQDVNTKTNLNLDPKKIIPCTKIDQIAGIDPTKVFYDHYYFEYLNV